VTRGRPSRQTIFNRFASALDELQQYGGLPKPEEATAIWNNIWHLEAHNSTAIEGNTLVLREVAQLLDAGSRSPNLLSAAVDHSRRWRERSNVYSRRASSSRSCATFAELCGPRRPRRSSKI